MRSESPSFFLESTAFLDTKAKPRMMRGESLFQNTDICYRSITELCRVEHTTFVFIRCIWRLHIINRQRTLFKCRIGYKFEGILIQLFGFIFGQNRSYYAIVYNKSVSVL